MKHLQATTSWVAVGLVTAVVGCGSNQVSIKGRVTFDGQPVGPGSIVFVPEAAADGIKVAAPIAEGNYEIQAERGAKPGTYRVEVSWSKKTGRQIPSADPGMMHDETKEAIPPQFNTQTTLTRELKPGENVLDFDLKSK